MGFHVIFACMVLLSVACVNGEESGCTTDSKTFKVGEQYDAPGYCNYNVCKGNNEWTIAACGLIGGPYKWEYVPEDPSRGGYPKCCGYIKPPHDIVPDVLDKLDFADLLKVNYDGIDVDMGNELTPTQVKAQPFVNYTADPSDFYLLCMTDPDAPSRENPVSREFLHWLVGNIPGNNVNDGEVIAEFIGSGPPKGTGLHRYVFLLYKQPGKLTFDEPKDSRTTKEHRPKFSIQKLAKKYELGDPVAINLYQAQYDDYVPDLHKQLGITPPAN